jgi:hypothetical protein
LLEEFVLKIGGWNKIIKAFLILEPSIINEFWKLHLDYKSNVNENEILLYF